jgi:hypothetical protein
MKNLVYLSVFHNKQYLNLLQLLMVSVKMFSDTTDIDFLVLTSAEFAPIVQTIADLTGIPLLTKVFEFTTMHEAACGRLHVFEYEHIDEYDKILYLDTDILVQGRLTNLFNEDIADKIHAIPERSVAREGYGAWFFDFAKVNKNTPGMNSGILFFRNTETARAIFSDAIQHITAARAEGKPLPACLDQPFINYHTIRRDKHDTTLLLKYAALYDDDPPPRPVAPTTIVLCHFSWPIGNAISKIKRMGHHIIHLLSNYGVIYGGVKPSDIYNVYVWRKGQIHLEDAGVLKTAWGRGTYKWHGSRALEATWAGYTHFIHFSPDYNSYLSVRKGDLECVSGLRKALN